jgi:hypothetical protein
VLDWSEQDGLGPAGRHHADETHPRACAVDA